MRSAVLAGARSFLIGILATTLLNLPVMAAGAPSVGMIVATDNALLSNVAAARGVNVYPGDILATQPGGSLRMAFGTNQLYLLGSTEATVAREGNTVRATLGRGAVAFSGTPGQFEIETSLGLIRGNGNNRTFGQVVMLDPMKIQVSAFQGELLVAGIDGTTKSIAAGETFEASLDSAGGPVDPGIQGVGRPKGIRWRRVAAAIVIFGGTALVTWALYSEFTESCSKINCGH